MLFKDYLMSFEEKPVEPSPFGNKTEPDTDEEVLDYKVWEPAEDCEDGLICSGDSASGTSLAQEMIDQQYNDYIVPKLNKLFAELFQVMKEKKLIEKKVYTTKESADIIDKIDKAISERFGIETRHLYKPYSFYTTLITLGKEGNILAKETDEMIEVLEKMYKDNKKAEKSPEEMKEMLDEFNAEGFYKQKDIVLLTMYNNLKKLNKSLNTSGVIINRGKANIDGLPKGYTNVIFSDFGMLRKFRLTPEETTAIVLHEIGHTFTYIENLYRNVRNTTVLIDTFLDNVKNKNKSRSESILIAYKKATGDTNVDSLKKTNPKALEVALLTNFVLDMQLTDNKYNSIDSEQQADQFSSRFGLNVHLVTALQKIDIFKVDKEILMVSHAFIAQLALIIGIFLMVNSTPVAGISVLALGIGVIIKAIVYNKYNMLDQEVNTEHTYDTAKQRYLRIRNDSVRILRQSELDKATIVNQIKNIEIIDNIINSLPDLNPPLFEYLYRKTYGGRRKLEYRDIDQLTEKLMENNLHIAAAKIRTI